MAECCQRYGPAIADSQHQHEGMHIDRVRIAHCLQDVRSGGVERRRLSLARGLDKKRFEQILICTEASPELTNEFQQAGCEVFPVGQLWHGIDPRVIASTRRLLLKFRPEIVHGAVFEGVVMAAVAGRLARVPIIIGEETSDPAGRRWTGHLYYRLLASLTDQMVAVSPAVAHYLTADLHIAAGKVRTIHNGVYEPPPAGPNEVQRVREEFGLCPQSFVVGCVGRLVDSHKRISDAIVAMQLIRSTCPDARLLVIGDGPDRAMLENYATSLGVASTVVFAGFQPRTRPFFEVMDMLLHPAGSEAFGLVLVEAMYAGLPVVATNVGGIPAVVMDGRTGFLVRPRQPEELADRILQLQRDPALRKRMGAAGLEHAREQFSEERYVGEVRAMYEELSNRRLGWRTP